MCLGVSEPTKRLAAQSTAYGLRNWQIKLTFVKENTKKKKNEKNEKKKPKSVKPYIEEFFSRLLTSYYLTFASYI